MVAWLYQRVLTTTVGSQRRWTQWKKAPRKTKIALKYTVRTENHGHRKLVSRGLLGSMSTENFDCVSCQLGKQPVLPFNTSESISTNIFDLIHSDVWEPSSVSSIGGSRYFVVFVDNYSRYNWIFNMKHRSELLQVYSNFAKMVET